MNGGGIHARVPVVLGCAFASALVPGLFLGHVAAKHDLSLSVLALPIGLLPGLVLRLFGAPRSAAFLLLAVLSVLPGLGLYGWMCTSRAPEWTAESHLTDDAKLDELVGSIKLVQLVNERQIAVWDYEQAPDDVKEDARNVVVGMSREEKLALCDEKYGKYLSEDPTRPGSSQQYFTPVMWIGLTLLCAVCPLVFGNPNDGGE